MKAALAAFKEQAGENFPDSAEIQLDAVIRSMARAWDATTARILRRARGASDDAGMGLIIQRMSSIDSVGECGHGTIRDIDPQSGWQCMEATYISSTSETPLRNLATDEFAEQCPEIFASLKQHLESLRRKFRRSVEVDFVVEDGKVVFIDYREAIESVRAAIASAVTLVGDGIISKSEASVPD